MTEQKCPICRSDSYLNPGLRILISPCFHKLCEQCVVRIFSRGYAPCPTCQTPLRRINFIASTFEDVEVAREVNIRRTMQRHFSRRPEEFANEVEYNDYLEEFENVVVELLELKSETVLKARINELKEENSILKPREIESKGATEGEEAVGAKKMRVSETPWTVFHSSMPFVPPEPLYCPPPALISPFQASGLTLKVINEMLFASLNCELNG